MENEISESTANDIMDYDSDESISSDSAGVDTLRSSSSASSSYNELEVAVPNLKTDVPQTFEWTALLNTPDFLAADVSLFKHAPVAYSWKTMTVGMKVEIEHSHVDNVIAEPAFWIAKVLKIHGYKALLRFEGLVLDSSYDFWVHLCSEDVHIIGWCEINKKKLIPLKNITSRFRDWKAFLVRRLSGARTLPLDFESKVYEDLKSKYELGTELEVMDKNRICQLRLASVQQIVGKRLYVKYFNSDDDGFWCHEESPLIHPAGWSARVGHAIVAPKSYRPEKLPKSQFNTSYNSILLIEGMKLEAVDPLNLSEICSATIKKVLKYGFIMVRVDSYEGDTTGSDWFCCHITSPNIFPCGFCEKHGIVLTPPLGYKKGSFCWDKYLKKTKSFRAPLLGMKDELDHGLKVGMKIEATDLMNPSLIYGATISKVIGRLLKVHFDGWEEEYDQWMDAASPDIYPVGWAELVDHKLEAPRAPPPPLPSKTTKRGRGRPKKAKKFFKVTANAAEVTEVAPTDVANKSPTVAEASTSSSMQNNGDNSRKILDDCAAKKEAVKRESSNNDGLPGRKILTAIPRAPSTPLPSKTTKRGRPKKGEKFFKVTANAAEVTEVARTEVANKSPTVAEASTSKSTQNNGDNSRKILDDCAAKKEAVKRESSNNDGLPGRKILTAIPRAPSTPLPSKTTKRGRPKKAEKFFKVTANDAEVAPTEVANKSPTVAEASTSKSMQNNGDNSRKLLDDCAAKKGAVKRKGNNNDGLPGRKILTAIPRALPPPLTSKTTKRGRPKKGEKIFKVTANAAEVAEVDPTEVANKSPTVAETSTSNSMQNNGDNSRKKLDDRAANKEAAKREGSKNDGLPGRKILPAIRRALPPPLPSITTKRGRGRPKKAEKFFKVTSNAAEVTEVARTEVANKSPTVAETSTSKSMQNNGENTRKIHDPAAINEAVNRKGSNKDGLLGRKILTSISPAVVDSMGVQKIVS